MTQIQPCDVMHTWRLCQQAELPYHGLGTVIDGYIIMPTGQQVEIIKNCYAAYSLREYMNNFLGLTVTVLWLTSA